jgi:hypothetical protein
MMSSTSEESLKDLLNAAASAPLSPVAEAAKNVIRIERKYFYSDRGSNKKTKEIREVIQEYASEKNCS